MSFLVSVVKKYSVLLFIVLVVLAASWPLFNAKMPFTHDFVHGARIAEMARALQDGHFPVRWSKNFSYGYGMPLFEFYAPFPFYLGAVFYLLGVPLVPSVKLIFLLATLLTAWGSYLLGRELRGRWAGLLLTALITLAPYRALNLFIRGAISEIWGITAAVWVLYTTLLVLKHGKKSAPYLILSLACLFLSHNLVTIIFLPFAALFTVGIFLIKNEEYRQGISKGMYAIQQGVVFAASYLLAIGVAAFYLFPAVLEKDYTKVEQMVITSYFNYHLHFLYIRQFFRPGWGYGGSEWGPNDPLSFFLGFGELFACLLTIICVLFATARVIRQHKLNKALQPIALALLFLALTALSLFFTTEKSLFIWEHSGILKFLQFPWRYLSSSLLFLGLSGIVWLWYLPTKLHAPVALLCIAITFACNTLYFKPEKFLDTPSALYYSDENKIQAQMSGILPDYIPKQLKLPITPPETFAHCTALEDCQDIKNITRRTQYTSLQVTVIKPTILEFAIADFPGWKVSVNGQPVTTSVTPVGLLSVQLEPAQDARITVYFTDTPVRYWSDLISALSVLIVCTFFIYEKKRA